MRVLCVLAAVLAASALLVACGPNRPSQSGPAATTTPSSPNDESPILRPDPDGNLVLYVSNQSFDLDPVDIAIELDGARVVGQSFEVESQHNWERFVLRVAPGDHTLRAHSVKGDATLTKRFTVEDKHWAVVDFWYSDGKSGTPTDSMFTFSISDRPVGFQ